MIRRWWVVVVAGCIVITFGCNDGSPSRSNSGESNVPGTPHHIDVAKRIITDEGTRELSREPHLTIEDIGKAFECHPLNAVYLLEMRGFRNNEVEYAARLAAREPGKLRGAVVECAEMLWMWSGWEPEQWRSGDVVGRKALRKAALEGLLSVSGKNEEWSSVLTYYGKSEGYPPASDRGFLSNAGERDADYKLFREWQMRHSRDLPPNSWTKRNEGF